MDAKISVIVPVYNCREYLPECIESILNQTYQQIQLVLVDDGSSDGSGEICDLYALQDDRVQVIHQKNKGVSAARNAGMDAMTGEYLLFVDGDDTIAAETIQTSLQGFTDKAVGVVVFGITKIWKDKCRQQALPMEVGLYSAEDMLCGILKDYAGFGAGYPWNKVWRVEAFGGIAGIPRFDKTLYYFEDLEWVVRMLLQVKKANLLPGHFYQYDIRGDSATNKSGTEERREMGYHQSVWKIIEALKQVPTVCVWFRNRYYPEIVNGVVHAWKNKFRGLQQLLTVKLAQIYQDILASNTVCPMVKLRCVALLLLIKLHVL